VDQPWYTRFLVRRPGHPSSLSFELRSSGVDGRVLGEPDLPGKYLPFKSFLCFCLIICQFFLTRSQGTLSVRPPDTKTSCLPLSSVFFSFYFRSVLKPSAFPASHSFTRSFGADVGRTKPSDLPCVFLFRGVFLRSSPSPYLWGSCLHLFFYRSRSYAEASRG